MSFHVHPTAIVASTVVVGEGASIGAYAIVGEPDRGAVYLAPACRIGHHSVILHSVSVGARTTLDPFSRVGPSAKIGDDTRLLYGARIHEDVEVGDHCVIAGNCPDRTTVRDHVVHLGKISHSFYHPFADWDEAAEPGPFLESHVVIGTDANIIGPVRIGPNAFIFPREIVRRTVPPDSIVTNGQVVHMPHWAAYLRSLGQSRWAETP